MSRIERPPVGLSSERPSGGTCSAMDLGQGGDALDEHCGGPTGAPLARRTVVVGVGDGPLTVLHIDAEAETHVDTALRGGPTVRRHVRLLTLLPEDDVVLDGRSQSTLQRLRVEEVSSSLSFY
jgi:hypothetical protein